MRKFYTLLLAVYLGAGAIAYFTWPHNRQFSLTFVAFVAFATISAALGNNDDNNNNSGSSPESK